MNDLLKKMQLLVDNYLDSTTTLKQFVVQCESVINNIGRFITANLNVLALPFDDLFQVYQNAQLQIDQVLLKIDSVTLVSDDDFLSLRLQISALMYFILGQMVVIADSNGENFTHFTLNLLRRLLIGVRQIKDVPTFNDTFFAKAPSLFYNYQRVLTYANDVFINACEKLPLIDFPNFQEWCSNASWNTKLLMKMNEHEQIYFDRMDIEEFLSQLDSTIAISTNIEAVVFLMHLLLFFPLSALNQLNFHDIIPDLTCNSVINYIADRKVTIDKTISFIDKRISHCQSNTKIVRESYVGYRNTLALGEFFTFNIEYLKTLNSLFINDKKMDQNPIEASLVNTILLGEKTLSLIAGVDNEHTISNSLFLITYMYVLNKVYALKMLTINTANKFTTLKAELTSNLQKIGQLKIGIVGEFYFRTIIIEMVCISRLKLDEDLISYRNKLLSLLPYLVHKPQEKLSCMFLIVNISFYCRNTDNYDINTFTKDIEAFVNDEFRLFHLSYEIKSYLDYIKGCYAGKELNLDPLQNLRQLYPFEPISWMIPDFSYYNKTLGCNMIYVPFNCAINTIVFLESQSLDKLKDAQTKWENILARKSLELNYQILCFEEITRITFLKWNTVRNTKYFHEVEGWLKQWGLICERHNLFSSLCKVFLLRAKFEMAFFKFDTATNWLERCREISEKSGLIQHFKIAEKELENIKTLSVESSAKIPSNKEKYEQEQLNDFLSYLTTISAITNV